MKRLHQHPLRKSAHRAVSPALSVSNAPRVRKRVQSSVKNHAVIAMIALQMIAVIAVAIVTTMTARRWWALAITSQASSCARSF